MLEGFFSLLKNLMLFSSYVDNKNSFPQPLSAEKEAEYLNLAKTGDKNAKEVLIKHNLRLVAHIAKKYTNYNDSDELISVGSIGLIKAINTFQIGKGTRLATYASRCIENEILMTIRANKKHKANVSLQEPVGTDKDGNELSLIDLLSADEKSIIDDVENKIMMRKLQKIIKTTLDEREYNIIVERYGLFNIPAKTQKEVAKLFGISRSYVSRIEKKALSKIYDYIKKENIIFD